LSTEIAGGAGHGRVGCIPVVQTYRVSPVLYGFTMTVA
jgi:hypothetical protein